MKQNKKRGGVWIFSDPHFSHANLIHRYRGFKDIKSHDDMIIENWNKIVGKRDKVYLLGDLSMGKDVSDLLLQLNGNITLVCGNHEKVGHIKTYLNNGAIDYVAGIIKHKGYWLSHAPIHPSELRGCKNIHGHIHNNSIRKFFGLFKDGRYINVCADACNFTPIHFDDIKNEVYK